ncbi:facilitated trehalose transporter Tret1-like [Athalia rosae]|uniref:facilitated trehalose transporter Tret1-like n=1 Tax=Athalia rosae TaxID=37344 RepID=UPI0020345E73|nr:facilitated trehalose transporter Tret1-like [Athalia rosae]XP_048508820.1 facilitated trehalose transporter Tret1-like [Athalia rosae]XP_048508821.1 facilitated trehalose transporter Tret1-like [Athalia rosae]XP_048508822.1 facilitated trehalose transporter Tret1-like [Athalia rosae]XP_048508823.1 facilitated trehalose transporter Tret1-like [Athalia rosae]XP_048508824.1 facilitated trehalose transporter Tret1-like [Athalia rosae]
MEEPRRKIGTQIIAGFAATLSSVCTGYHFGWSSPSLPKLRNPDSDIYLTSGQGAWVSSIFKFGAMLSPLLVTVLVRKAGRKWLLLASCIPQIASGILLVLAQGYWWLICARFIAGIGSGTSNIASSLYIGEIADDKIRGALGAIISQMMNLGILLAYSIGPWVSRVPFGGMGILLPVVFGLVFVWMPESPYYLIMKNEPERATKALQWLRGTEDVKSEIDKIKASIEYDLRNAANAKDLIVVPGNRMALIIILGVMFTQQMSGITAILTYSGTIFAEAGSTLDPSVSLIIVGVVQFLSGILCIFTVDLAGRKLLLLISTAGSAIFLVGVALYFQLKSNGFDVSPIFWLPLVSMVGFILIYTIGLGIIPGVVLSELFPYNLKASAGMAVITMAGLCGLIVTKLYQVVVDAWGIEAAFWGFAGITAFCFIFILFFVPETKQKSLQEIQEQLHRTTESTTALEKSGY